MADYLAEHPRADEPTAPLWPGRTNAGGWRSTRGARVAKRRQTALDWSEPVDMGTFYRRVFRPALIAVGLPASQPAGPRQKPSQRGTQLRAFGSTTYGIPLRRNNSRRASTSCRYRSGWGTARLP
jgi:integrase